MRCALGNAKRPGNPRRWKTLPDAQRDCLLLMPRQAANFREHDAHAPLRVEALGHVFSEVTPMLERRQPLERDTVAAQPTVIPTIVGPRRWSWIDVGSLGRWSAITALRSLVG